MHLKWIHWLFPNSEPPGRGLDIKAGPESVQLLGVGGGPWTTPLVGLNESNFSNSFLKGINGFGPVGMDQVGLQNQKVRLKIIRPGFKPRDQGIQIRRLRAGTLT